VASGDVSSLAIAAQAVDLRRRHDPAVALVARDSDTTRTVPAAQRVQADAESRRCLARRVLLLGHRQLSNSSRALETAPICRAGANDLPISWPPPRAASAPACCASFATICPIGSRSSGV